jgi:DNA-binding PadR family transcriptional regulator
MDLSLVIMGLLLKGPAHGYDLKQMLEKELSSLFRISASPLYYTLKKLEKDGFVSNWSAVSGNRPKKYVYSLTPSGRRKIKKTLLQNISDLQRPFFNLDISLYFLNFLEPEDIEKTLKERQKVLRKLIFLLERQKKELTKESSKNRERIITVHNLRFAQAEMDFVKDLLNAISKGMLNEIDTLTEVKENNDRR